MTILSSLFEIVGEQLDGIIDAYRREKPPHPETIVEYANGSISSFNIEGELEENSIPDKENAVKVDIGTAVTSIWNSVFYGCSGLTSITIPDGMTSIGEYAFFRCSGLTSITIPNSVTSIGQCAFYGCSGLASVVIPDGMTSIETSVFSDCSGLTSVTIPNSVTSIGEAAFAGCSGLTSITIPDGVTSIGDAALSWCNELMSVSFFGKTKTQVQGMSNYSWELNTGCTIHCTDGDIVL